jgi:hypothetical protein
MVFGAHRNELKPYVVRAINTRWTRPLMIERARICAAHAERVAKDSKAARSAAEDVDFAEKSRSVHLTATYGWAAYEVEFWSAHAASEAVIATEAAGRAAEHVAGYESEHAAIRSACLACLAAMIDCPDPSPETA